MSDQKLSRWERIKAGRINTPELEARYQYQRRYFAFVRQLTMSIEEERKRQHLTKAALAARMGANAAVVRRLLTAKTINPTLRTVFDALDAVGLEVRVEPTVGGSASRRASGIGATDPQCERKERSRGGLLATDRA